MSERDLIVITAAILSSGDRTLGISTAILLAEELMALVKERQKSSEVARPSIPEQRQMGVED